MLQKIIFSFLLLTLHHTFYAAQTYEEILQSRFDITQIRYHVATEIIIQALSIMQQWQTIPIEFLEEKIDLFTTFQVLQKAQESCYHERTLGLLERKIMDYTIDAERFAQHVENHQDSLYKFILTQTQSKKI